MLALWSVPERYCFLEGRVEGDGTYCCIVAKGLTSTRALVVAADDNQVYVELFRVPNGDPDVTLLLTPAAARDLANALSAAAGYVERSPREGTRPR